MPFMHAHEAPVGDPFGLGGKFRYSAADGVWEDPGAPAFDYSDGEREESYLLHALAEARDLSCASDELPRYIRDWPSEYHLSPLRQNLLRGLRCGPTERILEVGSGAGAITRLLGETGASVLAVEGSPRRARLTRLRCRDLENVHVLNTHLQRLASPGGFDVATLIGVLEYAPRFFPGPEPALACLRHVRGLLKEGGALVIAIENRLGLKYWNGCTEDHTNGSFDSQHDLYAPGSAQTWGRGELCALLREAGLHGVEFNFPFPDYKLPRVLVSARALARSGFDAPAIFAPHASRDYLHAAAPMMSEQLVWPVLARNGLAGELANSFLVVASKGEPRRMWICGDWLARSFAAERRAAFRTQTVFRDEDDGIVVHRSLLCRAEAPPGPLRHRGAERGGYRSGRVYAARLARLVFENDAHERYLEYFARYAAYLAPATLRRAPDDRGFASFLPGDYFDCIPVNLIEDEDGRLQRFDQEWQFRDSLPLGYVLFRAVLHDVPRLRYLPDHRLFGGAANLGEFLRAVLERSGFPLGDAQYEWCIGTEQQVLEQVLTNGDRRNVRDELAAPLAATFPPLLDPLRARDGLARAAKQADLFAALESRLAQSEARVRLFEQSYSLKLGRALTGAFRPLRRLRPGRAR
jgi:SAM-dependent methyltransferase